MTLCLGDMNCCPIKSHTIQNTCEQYDLTNLIKEPTCHKGPTPSLLDVLVSNSRRYASTLYVFRGLSALIRSITDEHAPMKSKVVKSASVPYMNSALRKAQYKPNMARNKVRKFGKHNWEENRRTRDHVVKIKKSQCEPTSTKTARNMARISGPHLALSLQINASGTQIISFFVKTTTL